MSFISNSSVARFKSLEGFKEWLATPHEILNEMVNVSLGSEGTVGTFFYNLLASTFN